MDISKIVDRLKYYFKVTIIFDKYDVLGDKDSPVDKGKKFFDILYKYRSDIKGLRKLVLIDWVLEKFKSLKNL